MQRALLAGGLAPAKMGGQGVALILRSKIAEPDNHAGIIIGTAELQTCSFTTALYQCKMSKTHLSAVFKNCPPDTFYTDELALIFLLEKKQNLSAKRKSEVNENWQFIILKQRS